MKAKIYNFKTWIPITEVSRLKELMRELLQKSGFEILNSVEHNFSPQGHTSVWLLAESHLAVHTFPEEGKTYVEISSCNEKKNNYFISLLNKHIAELCEKDAQINIT